MSRIAILPGGLVALGATNPVTYGQQLCVMLKSGISQGEKACSYIAKEHTKAAMANPQTVIP
jgi:hypothetical protein